MNKDSGLESQGLEKPKQYQEALQQTARRLQILFDELGLNPNHIPVNVLYPAISALFEHLTLSGEIKPDGLAPHELNGKVIGIINNISIPPSQRKKGFGTRIVDIWESTLTENGISYAVATGIKNDEAKTFWAKRGYVAPQEENGKRVPYCMYKILSPK